MLFRSSNGYGEHEYAGTPADGFYGGMTVAEEYGGGAAAYGYSGGVSTNRYGGSANAGANGYAAGAAAYDYLVGMGTGGNAGNTTEYRNYGGDNAQTLYIRVDGDESGPLLDSAYATLKYFSGRTPVVLYNRNNKTRRELGRDYWVKPSATLINEMRERFGAENVVIK